MIANTGPTPVGRVGTDKVESVSDAIARDETQVSLFPDLDVGGVAEFATGILATQHLEELVVRNWISVASPLDADQVQPASLDLRLGRFAYEVKASFLPGETGRVMRRIDDLLVECIDLSSSAVLRKGAVYVIPLQESLALPDGYWGKANPKSTTGRLDILTRLITDYTDRFESVPWAYKGSLFVEVFSRTFDIRVREGTRLNQLRIVRGEPRPSDSQIRRLHDEVGVLFSDDREKAVNPLVDRGAIWVGVDLQPRDETAIVGYKARHRTSVIDLSRINHYEPEEFWEPILANPRRMLILEPGEFYILVSKERVRVPPAVAAEMVAYEPSAGEFRPHYAGFFDPGFGFGSEMHGTPAVLEVRSHEVPFVLEDGQHVARLIYERLIGSPSRLYGLGIGSSYQGQRLALSKQFRRAERR
jgi:dCTP deaminase